jgi:hypothetical protein
MIMPAIKLRSARQPSITPTGGGQDRHLRGAQLDDRADVLQNDIAAGALGEAVADLLADHLVVSPVKSDDVRIGNGDDLHRHFRVVKKQGRFVTAVDQVLVLVFARAGGGQLLNIALPPWAGNIRSARSTKNWPT